MASYSVIFADLLTGVVRGRFRLGELTYSRRLNDAGSFSGTIAPADRRQLAKDPISSTTLAKTAVYVERNEQQIVWGGIAWTRRRTRRMNETPQPMQVGGTEFWAYLRRREIVHSLVFSAVDQLALVRDLVAYAQGQQLNVVTGNPVTYSKPGGNLRITVGAETSGVLRTATYDGTQHPLIGPAVQDLASLDQGFDFSIDPQYTAGQGSSITRPLVLSYPRRGRPASASTLRWAYGGNMLGYDWPEDATAIATTSYALGPGEGAAMLQSSSSAQYLIDAGYPLLEQSRSYKSADVTQAILDAHARADSLADGMPAITLPTIIADGSKDPQIGAYVCGDECQVVIDDENFPSAGGGGSDQSVNTVMRIQGYTVSVDGVGRETVELILGPVVPS